jgi:subtilisin-like proprotein convertase family protein
MAADALIWVQGNMTSTLLLWNGTSWQPKEGLTYFFDQNQATPTTDLYVPFSALGINDPSNTTLAMLAVASEKNALRLWATMPSSNNLNSERIVASTGPSKLQQFALTKNFSWKLADGVCPGVTTNVAQGGTLQADTIQGVPTGAAIKATISSQPSGVAYSLISDNLFFAMKDLPQFAGIDWGNTSTAFCTKNPEDSACQRDTVKKPTSTQASLAKTMDVHTSPVGDKNLIIHTLELLNTGTVSARNLVSDLYTFGPVRLPGGEKRTDSSGEYDVRTLQIGDLAPGQSTSIPIPAMIDATFDKQNQQGKATLDITVYDATGSHQQLLDGTDVYTNELDWLHIDHEVDTSPPDYIEILSPQGVLRVGDNVVSGFVYDRSPVPTVEMEIQQPDGQTQKIVCEDETPEDKAWECVVNTDGAKDGESFALRVRATDNFGLTGAWSPWTKFVIDATSPEVSLDAASQTVLNSGLVGFNQALLSGTVWDNNKVSGEDVCEVVDGAEVCQQANIGFNPDGQTKTTYTYEDQPPAPLAIGKNTPCSNPLVRTFVVTDNFTLARAKVRLNIAHTLRGDLNVTLQSPKGTKVTLLYDGTKAKNYDVLLDDASATLDRDDTADHDLASPSYKNQRGGYGLLSTLKDETATGTWKLTICDAFPTSDDGTYNQSQLTLQAPTVMVSTTASWDYTLPISKPTVEVQTVEQEDAGKTGTTELGPNTFAPFTVFLPLVAKTGGSGDGLSEATPTPSLVPTASPTPSAPIDLTPKTLTIYGLDSRQSHYPTFALHLSCR